MIARESAQNNVVMDRRRARALSADAVARAPVGLCPCTRVGQGTRLGVAVNMCSVSVVVNLSLAYSVSSRMYDSVFFCFLLFLFSFRLRRYKQYQ